MKKGTLFLMMISFLTAGVITLADKDSTPLTKDGAKKIAETWLAGHQPPPPYESNHLIFEFERTEEYDFGWVFYYNSEKYLKSKDPSDMMVGNGPLIIDRSDRQAHPVTTSVEPKEALAIYAKTWNAKHGKSK